MAASNGSRRTELLRRFIGTAGTNLYRRALLAQSCVRIEETTYGPSPEQQDLRTDPDRSLGTQLRPKRCGSCRSVGIVRPARFRFRNIRIILRLGLNGG